MKRATKENIYQALVNKTFGKELMPSFNCMDYALDEDIVSPTPRCLVQAGWKVTAERCDLPHNPGIYIIHCGERENFKLYLYVGQGLDLQARLYNHPCWRKAVKEYTTPLIFFRDFKQVDKRQLLRFEAYMIGVTNPIWNFGNITGLHNGLGVIDFKGLWDD